jgi:phage replication-related protein YjqB (UPF0714/DUF867 family)
VLAVLADLLREEGVREECVLGSRFGFLAVHGGSLERVTDAIARAAAERAGASLYAVVQPPQLRWHVPSRHFDPAASPTLATFLAHVEIVISVHGYGSPGRWRDILVGGSNRTLAETVGRVLSDALPHYTLVTDLDALPAALRGLHPDNPVNRPRSGGVQLELPPRVRGLGPFWSDHAADGFVPHTAALVDALALVAREWEEAA